MAIAGLLVITPLFGPLMPTLHYLADFFAERPQSMRGPGASFYAELLALLACGVGVVIFAIALILFLRDRSHSHAPDG